MVVVKNRAVKYLGEDDNKGYFFSGNCFIVKKISSDTSNLNIKWLNSANISKYKSKEDASNRIRQIYFEEFAAIRNNEGKSLYTFNINDMRFWDGPIWKN